jgi:hypothetical protein
MQQHDREDKKYIKICKDSGCVSANYNISENYENETTLISKDTTESSGSFTHLKSKPRI